MRLFANLSQKQLIFLRHIIRKNCTNNLIFTGRIGGKRNRGEQRTTSLMNLCEWMAKQQQVRIIKIQMLVRYTRDRMLITFVPKVIRCFSLSFLPSIYPLFPRPLFLISCPSKRKYMFNLDRIFLKRPHCLCSVYGTNVHW